MLRRIALWAITWADELITHTDRQCHRLYQDLLHRLTDPP